MSSFELNKVVGAVLLAVLVLVVIGKVGDNLVSTGGGHGGDGHGAVTVSATPSAPAKDETPEPILGLLASADPANGQKVFAKCKACHTVDNGGKNAIGPNLWNIVNRTPGNHDGFGYSDTLKDMSDRKWSYANLNLFLAKPKDYAKGTKMTFAGLKKTSDRANVIAYLRTLSDAPAALPSQAEIDAAKAAMENEAAEVAGTAAQAADAAKPAATEAKPAMAEAAQKPVGEMIAAADADRGQKVFNKCKACHTVDKGGKNGIGPNLWNIVNRAPAGVDGFKYSDAIEGLKNKPWSFENLDAFLAKPKDYAKGTKMTFVGLPKDRDRFDLLAYLRTLADSPAPLK